MLDQILFALPARQLLRLLVELDADGAVDLLRFGGEGLYYVLCPRLVSGAPQAADALWSEGQLHSAVDPLEHARQLPLALDEHDAPYARRLACDPLRDPHDFHAAFPIPNPYAVVPRAELFAHLPHLGRNPETREGAEDQGRCLVVALPDAASRLLLVRGPDDRETEGARRSRTSHTTNHQPLDKQKAEMLTSEARRAERADLLKCAACAGIDAPDVF